MTTIPTRQPKTPEVSVSDTSAEEKLLTFVNEQIERMRTYTKLGNGIPSFFELNEALANWSNMNCSFIALDVLAKEEYQKAKDAYDDFMADKYMEARSILNPLDISATKWCSQKEIEYYVQSRWSFEYRALRDEMNAKEKKVAVCRRLLENLDSFKFNLGTLSKNVQAEVLNLHSNDSSFN